MELNPKHAKALELYMKWRGGPLRITDLMIASWPRYTYLLMVVGGVSWFLWHQGQFIGSAILGGFLVGSLYGDFQRLFVNKRFWEVQREVLDWKRIQELTESSSNFDAREE